LVGRLEHHWAFRMVAWLVAETAVHSAVCSAVQKAGVKGLPEAE
jgi:hypothetical protein